MKEQRKGLLRLVTTDDAVVFQNESQAPSEGPPKGQDRHTRLGLQIEAVRVEPMDLRNW